MSEHAPAPGRARWLDTALFALACIAGLLILILQLAEIAARMLGSSVVFASESTAFLMAIMVFLALPDVTRRSEHITADFIVLLMGPRLRRLIEAFVAPLALLIYAGVLGYLLFGLASSSYVDSVRSDGILRLPLFIPQAILFTGVVFTILRLVLMLVDAFGKSAEGKL